MPIPVAVVMAEKRSVPRRATWRHVELSEIYFLVLSIRHGRQGLGFRIQIGIITCKGKDVLKGRRFSLMIRREWGMALCGRASLGAALSASGGFSGTFRLYKRQPIGH